MDAMHFYLYHCFDVGLRVKKQNNANDKHKEEKKSYKYFDGEFSRINKIICSTRRITKSFERFSTGKNGKFSLITTEDEQISILSNGIGVNTFIDALYQYLKSNKNIYNSAVQTLNDFMDTEEYDTDGIEYDLNIYNGNIAQHVRNSKISDEMINFVKIGKVSSSQFSVGFRFYYWDYFKQLNNLTDKEQGIATSGVNNYIDHCGHKVCDLFIIRRYSSFKEEISFYQYLTMTEYKKNVLFKANKYMNANIVKQTTALIWTTYSPYVQHYGIKEGDRLTFSHLLSIILYCDYGDLCSVFNSTFRKISNYERIENVKKRNSNYYFLAKYLREVVECYGQNSYDGQWKYRNPNGALSGPFYCGMNKVFTIPSFNIRLYSPTSTSIHIEVAMKFSGEEGIILQFDNPNSNQYNQYISLMCFNMSCISRYKEEDERLFFGGFYPIKLVSVRIRNTKQNFEEFIYRLYYLDTCLTGGDQKKLKINKNEISAIKHLFFKILKKPTKHSVDKYIYNTFLAFVQSKKQIILDLHKLYEANNPFIDILMHKINSDHIDFRDASDFTNLFGPNMLLIFKNVTTIIINTTDKNGWYSYSLSMACLLSLIEESSIDKVIVKSITSEKQLRNERCRNWILSLWNTYDLIKFYKTKNYDISIKKERVGDWIDCQSNCKYWFEISKQN
eukprot:353320_1